MEPARITRVTMRDFKGFREATLEVGDFTVLVGANASGKSNVRDAFRVLHGISRGYSVAEILGEKWIEGGFLQWRGVRGGALEAAFNAAAAFRLKVEFTLAGTPATYQFAAGVIGRPPTPLLLHERIEIDGVADEFVPAASGARWQHPYLFERRDRSRKSPDLDALHCALSSIRFLDLSPEALRIPSLPGQTILGDRGENLSSVLQAMCADPDRKRALLEWLRQLSPVDVADLDFVSDAAGRILLVLVESNGRRISALSASDGTLRFLALVAALLSDEPRLYFLEEVDTGLHPTRLHLLINLIEAQTAKGAARVIATTHSPQLLSVLSDKSLQAATLAYRLPDADDQRLIRIAELPDAQRVLRQHDIARLQASGWLEDAATYLQSRETESAR